MTPHLMFTTGGTRWLVDARSVVTTLRMPWLWPVEDLPPWFAGLLDLQGAVVPVVDLPRRFGHATTPWHEAQFIVLLQGSSEGLHEGSYEASDAGPTRRFGLVADAVEDVMSLTAQAVEPYPTLDPAPRDGSAASPLATAPPDESAASPVATSGGRCEAPPVGAGVSVIGGCVRLGDGVSLLLDVRALMRSVWTAGDALPGLMQLPSAVPGSLPDEPVPAAGGEDARQRMLQRTRRLAQRPPAPSADRRQVAVVRVGDERFGLELSCVTAFVRLGPVTPLPGCQDHVLGCTSLRGALVPVFDPAPLLGVARAPHGLPAGLPAVVVTHAGHPVALTVDEVLGLIEASAEDERTLDGAAFAEAHVRALIVPAEGHGLEPGLGPDAEARRPDDTVRLLAVQRLLRQATALGPESEAGPTEGLAGALANRRATPRAPPQPIPARNLAAPPAPTFDPTFDPTLDRRPPSHAHPGDAVR